MHFFRNAAILTFLFAASLLSGCSSGANNNSLQNSNTTGGNANAESANTNAEELGMLVKVPFEPEDIVWKSYSSGKRVVAVLRFSTADSEKVVAESLAFGTPAPAAIEVEPWFPEELTAQGEMSGDNALKGMAYSANVFAQEPFSNGRVTRIEGSDFFVLDISAK